MHTKVVSGHRCLELKNLLEFAPQTTIVGRHWTPPLHCQTQAAKFSTYRGSKFWASSVPTLQSKGWHRENVSQIAMQDQEANFGNRQRFLCCATLLAQILQGGLMSRTHDAPFPNASMNAQTCGIEEQSSWSAIHLSHNPECNLCIGLWHPGY